MKNLHPARPLKPLLVAATSLFWLILGSCATTEPIGRPTPLTASEGIRASIAEARDLRVHEGLPHQKHESALLEREMARTDVTRIASWPFYAPAEKATHPALLRRLLVDPASYGVYSGPKTCGGFHPDYAVTWESGGAERAILICFGCSEALIAADGRTLPYDLRQPATGQLLWALQHHDRKRPRP